MAKTPHTLAVFIGRTNPWHRGHTAVLKSAAKTADSALVLSGSAYRPRSWKNPFTFSERKAFIANVASALNIPVNVLPLVDTLYNDRAWQGNVRLAVEAHMRTQELDPTTTRVVLTGFDKDKSSRYLKWFPEWEMLPCPAYKVNGQVLNASDFREAFFLHEKSEDKLAKTYGDLEVKTIFDWRDRNQAAYDAVQEEGTFIEGYKAKSYAAQQVFGHPIPINTVDAVIVQAGHILLVKRGEAPGRGLWALPGGHIEPSETAEQAVVREVYEEALDMPKGAMTGRIRERRVFDHPERSERGWVRTEAFRMELMERDSLEKVRAASDADEARWFPLHSVTPDILFEDHFDIIQAMVPDVPFAYSSILMAHAN